MRIPTRLLLAAVLTLLSSGCSGSSDTPGDDPVVVSLPGDLTFELPTDWKDLDSELLAGGMDEGVKEDMAGRLGMDTAQFDAMIAQTDAFVTAPHAEDGFLSNVNVLHFPGQEVPTDAQVQMQYRSLGASDVSLEHVTTALGEAIETEYLLEVKGVQMDGSALVFEHEGNLYVITASTSDNADTESLMDQITESLAVAS